LDLRRLDRRGDFRRGLLLPPFVYQGTDQGEQHQGKAGVEQRRAPVAARQWLAMAPGDLAAIGRFLLACRHALDKRLRVELEQPRIAAHHAAGDRRPGQAIEALVLQRFDLAREELELVGHAVYGEAGSLAPPHQHHPNAGKDQPSQDSSDSAAKLIYFYLKLY
jgi:hypothetical protein